MKGRIDDEKGGGVFERETKTNSNVGMNGKGFKNNPPSSSKRKEVLNKKKRLE